MKPSLSALADAAFARLTPVTRRRYCNVWTDFTTRAGVATLPLLQEMTGVHLEAALDKMRAEYAPATVALTLAVVRCVVRKGLQLDALTHDSTVGVKAPVGDNVPRGNVLQPGELEKLATKLPLGSLERAVVLALALQGLRRAELCAARWGDVKRGSDGRWELHLVGKGDKPAVMGLQPLVLDAAWAWVHGWTDVKGVREESEANCGTVAANPFIGQRDTPLKAAQVYRMVLAATSKHLGRRVTPHGLRATFVSDVIARKGIETARQLARHSNITTTTRYSRWLATRDDDRVL